RSPRSASVSSKCPTRRTRSGRRSRRWRGRPDDSARSNRPLVRFPRRNTMGAARIFPRWRMLSQQDTEALTRVGPGTAMGALMRRYWVPAAFSHQIARPDAPPVRVRLLGENLVLFRDTQGRIGLVDERCPHRTASLFYGRNEQGGLRCVYHGLKFDVDGNCVEAPCVPQLGEAQKANVQAQLKVKAYPCLERGEGGGTYAGPAANRPESPAPEGPLRPPAQRYATRHIKECNGLQALEGGFDATHLPFLQGGEGSEATRRIVSTLYEVIATDFG